ncbi:MAG: deoxyhypusine synthase family protein [Myxococcota bacterium]
MSSAFTREYRDGFSDGFEPLKPIDVTEAKTVSALLEACANTAFGGRRLGEAARTLEHMIRDPECFIVGTVSGAMTVAKQGLLLYEMIERGWMHAVVTTGALMSHGLVESSGMSHFKFNNSMDDKELLEKGYDRIYDTLELEQNLEDTERLVRAVVELTPEDTDFSSERFFYELGRYLDETTPKEARSFIKSAYRKNVPIYVPAFTDSELGLDFATLNHLRVREGKPRRRFDPYLDLDSYARLVSVQTRTGIFTIGGGVPRNWAQQAGPYLDLLEKRAGLPGRGFRFRYGVRVCPEPVHWGGLSGCTYSEGVSWGKFVPTSEGGRFSEVFVDATIAWPLLVRAMIERVGDDVIEKRLQPQPEPNDALFPLAGV